LPRSLSNKGYVIIKGVKCPILGNICMDQMMVDVSKITEEIKMGDLATIIGDGQTADDLAEIAGTCMHDILSSIAFRVNRTYI
ncbi:MAG: alanine racemase C-terminal domain-containing protein, partial [Bacillota bacterium]|nr:alanine racemase C-terminal domain-containing protein [Bacillota bacterium]